MLGFPGARSGLSPIYRSVRKSVLTAIRTASSRGRARVNAARVWSRVDSAVAISSGVTEALISANACNRLTRAFGGQRFGGLQHRRHQLREVAAIARDIKCPLAGACERREGRCVVARR